jgi:hypothetical protein
MSGGSFRGLAAWQPQTWEAGILRGLTNVPRLSLTHCMVLYQTPEHVLQHPAA